MKILDHLRARFGKPEQRRATPMLGSFSAGGLHGGGAGGLYNAYLAENLSVVTACVELISSTIASLPPIVYRATPGGREEAPGHPLSRLIANGVNERLPWFDWLQWSMGQQLLHGNSLSVIERNRDGELSGLWPAPWPNVNVGVTSDGAMVFDVQNLVCPWASYGERKRYRADEVLLIRARSDDSFLGRSVLSRAAGVIETATGTQQFAAAISRQGVNPSGTLSHPGKLGATARTYLNEEMANRHAGAINTRKVLLLDEGMQFSPFEIKASDAELLAARRYSGEELARLFSVPPSLIGEMSFGTYGNFETAGRFFSVFCIAPHVRRIESEFARSIFQDDGHHLTIDLSGLQRGDESARWQTYQIALSTGVLSIAEVRQAEGWGPIPAPGVAPPPQDMP